MKRLFSEIPYIKTERLVLQKVERFYTEEEPHRMFIGEVVEIITH